MKEVMNWMIKYWWIFLIVVLTAYIITIGIIDCKQINEVTQSILHNLELLVTPLGVILGLVLGYPLLKRKLVDGYITKRFEIIHDNNREVKKECLRLHEKYPSSYISKTLTKEYLDEAVQEMKILSQTAIDANQDAYKYSRLVYKALKEFADRYSTKIPNTGLSQYYNENISSFINGHLDQIYKYSQSIGYIPSPDIRKETILVDNLKEYVTDNHLYQVDNVNQSLSYKHTSALLVVFFSINIRALSKNNGLLFQCCYEVAPSPSPFVRMMLKRDIYIPPILYNRTEICVFEEKLSLVSFIREGSTNIASGVTTYSYVCYYANISTGAFVSGLMQEKKSLSKFCDEYIKESTLNIDDIIDYNVEGELIQIKIKEEKLLGYFKKVKRQIKAKMKDEMSKS